MGDSDRTVIERLEATAERFGDRPALRAKRHGRWQTTTWGEYRDGVFAVARGLMKLGVAPGRAVSIMGFNRPEWFLADLGTIAAGGVPAGIYTTNTAEQCRYIVDHADSVVVVLENPEYLEIFRTIRDELPGVERYVLMEGEAPDEDVLSWDELLALGEEVPEEELRRRIAAQQPSDLATLIYTSGTTGPPKGVMISHTNLNWMAQLIGTSFEVTPDESILSYLPLSHIAEQMVSLHIPLAVGACTWFAESLEKLRDNLLEVRPHFFVAVPRVWEKMQAGIQAAGAQRSPLARRIGAWARRVGLAAGYAEQQGGSRPLTYPLAERLVFSKVRERLGLDRARITATSTAPISKETLEFFLSLGMPLLEVYGMSECTGPTTLSTPDRYRTGAAGYAIPGTELAVAPDGEILMRGPHVCLGYYKNDAATRETIDEAGWLHSGDIGELTEDGFLLVTDRKKELLITSGGKNVAPQNLETALRKIPVVSQAAVVGDRRRFVSALLTLDPEQLAAAAEAAGSPATSVAEAASCPRFHAYMETLVDEVNQDLARFESIRKFTILPRELTVEDGELTPTMKLKRRVVYEHFADQIEAMYADG